MSPGKHAQRRRARTTAKRLYEGRRVHRQGKTYARVGFIDDDGARADGYWLMRAGRNDAFFYDADFTAMHP